MKRKWFEGFIRTKDADIKELSELVLAAKGDRSVAEFARACGVSTSTLTRIINQQTAGRISDFLLAQIALNAAPGSGVTIVKLLNAQGRYAVDGATDPWETLAQISAENTGLSMQNGTASANPASSIAVIDTPGQMDVGTYRRISAYAYAMTDAYNAAKQSRMAVQESLMSRRFTVGIDNDLTAINGAEFNCYADFVIMTDALEAEEIKRWAFIQLKETGNKACFGMAHYFGMLYLHDTDELATRVTFYTEDAVTYEMLKNMYRSESIPGSLSFMLIDEKEQRVVSEYVMSRKNDKEPVRLFGEGEPMDSQELYGVPDEDE